MPNTTGRGLSPLECSTRRCASSFGEVCAAASGKSTFVNCVRQGLGSAYVRTVRREALQQSRYRQGSTAHNGDLRHFKAPARFSFLMEMRGNLDSELIKKLSGGDSIEMRRIHKEDEHFRPTAMLWVMGNTREGSDAPELGIAEDDEDANAIMDRAKLLSRERIPDEEQDRAVVEAG